MVAWIVEVCTIFPAEWKLASTLGEELSHPTQGCNLVTFGSWDPRDCSPINLDSFTICLVVFDERG